MFEWVSDEAFLPPYGQFKTGREFDPAELRMPDKVIEQLQAQKKIKPVKKKTFFEESEV